MLNKRYVRERAEPNTQNITIFISANIFAGGFYDVIHRHCAAMKYVIFHIIVNKRLKNIYDKIIFCRNEYYFKNTILNQLLLKKHDMYSTVALTELPIAESKADFIMINGKGIVYEIKTDLDNLNRLENQIADYYKAFKYVNVIVGHKQYDKIKEMLEDSTVGIFVMCKNGNLRCKKVAKCNDKNLSYETMFRVLRKKEFESIILKHYGKLPEVNNFQYYRECLKWISQINVKTFQKDMLLCLKKKMQIVVEDTFEQKIPYELRFYAYFTKEKSNQYHIINKFWNDWNAVKML